MPDFLALASDFLGNQTLQDIYGYHKAGQPADFYTHAINLSSCEALVGTSPQYYNWGDAANTINTWVLPFTGLLLQGPFDSNDAMGTFWSVMRWTGGSMASFSYILWNMRSSANCAAFLDKGTKRTDFPKEYEEDEKMGRRRTEYASFRDAFFLLSVMNQYTVNVRFNGAAAEKLLKVALFSKQLRLPNAAGGNLEEVRQALARDTREARKRGTVQCFLSMLWFIFGMVISIQQSFGLLGQEAPAQNLALGLAMVWFPVLMLCTVVDRNPAVPEATMRQLNYFLALIREGLVRDAGKFRSNHQIPKLTPKFDSFDAVVTGSPIKTVSSAKAFETSPSIDSTVADEKECIAWNWFDCDECDSSDMRWIDSISDPALDDAEFFSSFAGQGRKLWHYGVAYPIIRGLKGDGIMDARRGWMYRENVRARLISTANWERRDRLHSWDLREHWQVIFSLIIVWSSMLSAFFIAYFTPTVGLGCRALGYLVFAVNCTGQGMVEMFIWAGTPHSRYHTKSYQRTRFYGLWFLRCAETINFVWLMYIIFAQALGSYNTCKCKCSDYGLGGGFIDLEIVLNNAAPQQAQPFWIAGTTLGCSIMALSFVFIAWEWVTQSHMSTENYDNAMKGLRTTRRFKK